MKDRSEYRDPPRLAEWILRKINSDKRAHTFLGDSVEIYNQIIDESGIFKAWFWYWFQLIQSLNSIIKNIFIGSRAMFKSYLKIAFRNITKYKVNNIISVTGLAIG
ncbi:MAG: hypothetical protein GY863_10430, partial [bacterium]|nr:hypothetical protein [bacterium]